jgi:hypothetical protein
MTLRPKNFSTGSSGTISPWRPIGGQAAIAQQRATYWRGQCQNSISLTMAPSLQKGVSGALPPCRSLGNCPERLLAALEQFSVRRLAVRENTYKLRLEPCCSDQISACKPGMPSRFGDSYVAQFAQVVLEASERLFEPFALRRHTLAGITDATAS